MTGNLKLLINFVEKFLGMVKFGNDQIAPIIGYGDLVQGAVTIKRVYYVEGLNRILHQTSVARTPEQNGVVERWNHTLVEAARTILSATKVPLFFWAEAIATSCFTQNRSLVIPRHEKTPYYIINDQKLSVKFFHIFGSLCYIVKDGKNLDIMKEKGDACIFVRGLHAQVRTVRTDKGTEFLNKTLHVYFAQEGIEHQMSVARTPKQNGVVKRRNRTLVEAARTMLSAAKVPLYFWAEAIATTCFT
nr:retrovirus-related Pol polyprotein from transposon TNT 1-94 [Tanacetum cinerariifolium]